MVFRLFLLLVLSIFLASIHCCFGKSVSDTAVNEHKREKRESGCCRDDGNREGDCCQDDGHEGGCCQDDDNEDGCCRDNDGQGKQGGKNEDGCCRDNDGKGKKKRGGGNDGGCCKDNDDKGKQRGGGNDGGCCKDNDGKGKQQPGGNEGDCCQTNNENERGDGCCQNTMGNDPNRYETGNAQPYGGLRDEIYNKFSLHDAKPAMPEVKIHKEELMQGLLGKPFLENVRNADENTLLFFSSMLAKLQNFLENLKFQMEEVRNDLRLQFGGFDGFARHSDKVIDGALAVVRKRMYELQWGGKKHSDLKNQKFAVK